MSQPPPNQHINSQHINSQRLLGRLYALAAITDPAQPFTRRAFTDLYLKGRAWLKTEMEAAGLEVALDAAGNLIGRREGSGLGQGTLMLGSHTDTVVGGGRFDGILGVLAALEVAHTLKDKGLILSHTLEVVDFLSEEPSDYGTSCVGSRGMAGTLSPDQLSATNLAGESLAAAMSRMGAKPETLIQPLRTDPPRTDPPRTDPPRTDIAAYLELHIEQGPLLEHEGLAIGVVSGIVGIERYELVFEGQPDHAGTTPMHLRKDALVAAAYAVQTLKDLAVTANERLALVATTGQLRVFPGNSNVVPSHVVMVFEARALDATALEAFCLSFVAQIKQHSQQQGIGFKAKLISRAAPLYCDERIRAALHQVCLAQGFSAKTLLSGAGHDAMQIGRIAPAGMLFVPSVAGRSHTPDELTYEQDLLIGAETLYHTTLELDQVFQNQTKEESHV